MVSKDTDAQHEKPDATSDDQHCQDSEITSQPSIDGHAERWSKEAAAKVEKEKMDQAEDKSTSSSQVADSPAEIKNTVDITREASSSTQADQTPKPVTIGKRRAMVPITLFVILLCASLVGLGFIQHRARTDAIVRSSPSDVRLAELNQAIERDHYNAKAYFERGSHYYLGREEGRNALRDLDRAIQLDPTMVDAYLMRADLATYLYNFEQANADVEKANKLTPNTEAVFYERARVAEEMEDHKNAIANCQMAIKLAPDNYLIYGVIADAYEGLGRYSDAIKAITRQLELYKVPHQWSGNYFARGLVKFHCRDFDGAIADQNEALKIDPDGGTARIARSYAEAAKGDISLAEADAAQGLLDESVPSRGHRLIGDLYRFLGKKERAIEEYGKAISTNSRSARSYRARGLVYYQLGQLQNALDDLQQAVSIHPGPTSLSYLARVEADLGQNKNADRDIALALNRSTPTSLVYSNDAVIKLKRGKGDEALAQAQKALAMDQFNADAYQLIGEIYKDTGRQQEAQQYFDKAKEYGYPNSEPPPGS